MNGHAQMDANAAATIAENQAARQVTSGALAANAEFDKGEHLHAEANVLNKQIDQGAKMAEKVDDIESRRMSIEARRTSPDVQAMNQAAEMRIFGSRGQTQGYVDAKGKPLTEPIKGVVDQIRGISQADEIRQNPRYGTKQSDRHAAADAYEAQFKAGQGERDARADGYVGDIEELQANGFELSQAELILNLRSDIYAKQHAMLDKLVAHAAGGRTLSAEEDQKIRRETVGRAVDQTVRQGDDVGMLMRIIKQEGLFSREEYEKFRYKRGNPKNGERKEFSSYREQSMADHKLNQDIMDRLDREDEHESKKLFKEQRRVQKAEAEAEAEAYAAMRDEANLLNDQFDRGRGHPLPPPEGPKGIRGRVQAAMLRASFYLGEKMDQAREYFSDDEKGKRRKVAAGVVGVLAVAGGAYLAYKGVPGGGSHGGEAALAPPVKPQHHEAVQHAQSVAQGNGGTTAPEHAQPSINGGTTAPAAGRPGVTELKSGQNPWTVSEHRLHELGNAHPSAAQIEHYDKAMAQANPDVYSYAGDSSENIPAGTVLKLPK